jgi:hypothetical protein
VADQGEALRQGRWEAARRRQEEVLRRQEELAPLLAAVASAGEAEACGELARLLGEVLEEVKRQQAALRLRQEELKQEEGELFAWRRQLQGLSAAIRGATPSAGGQLDGKG